MKDLNSIEELYKEVIEDKKERLPLINRYPTRLIFLPSFQMLREFVRVIDSHRIKKVELADFLSHFDFLWAPLHLITALSLLSSAWLEFTIFHPFCQKIV